MGAVTYFVSSIIDIIEDFFSASGFGSSLLLAPFVFWFIRQIIVMTKYLFSVLFK